MIRHTPGFLEIQSEEVTTRDPLDRMPDFVGLDARADARALLAGTGVLIVGVGSVGARMAMHAARLRVGRIDLVDPKGFSANFDTQPIRQPGDVGRPKASLVGGWIKQIAPPDTVVRALEGPVQTLSWLDLDRYDVVLASTDNLPVEVHLGAVCRALGKPLIYAAVHGPTLTAQVRVFTNANDAGPCPYCSFSREERDRMSSGVRYSCDPGASPAGDVGTQPTVSVSPLCSLAAAVAMIELLRMRLGLGPAPRDCVREISGYAGTATETALERNPSCPVDHAVLERVGLGRPLGECTLRDCAAAGNTTGDRAIAHLSFTVDDCMFVPVLACGCCGTTRAHNRFMDRRHAVLYQRCHACNHRGLGPHPFFSFDRQIPAGRGGLMPHLDVPLSTLGAEGRGVAVHGQDRAILVQSLSDGSTS